MKHETIIISKSRKMEVFTQDDGTVDEYYYRRGRYNKWEPERPTSNIAKVLICILFFVGFPLFLIVALLR